MNSAIKWVVALLVVALIVVIGLIFITTDSVNTKQTAPAAPVTTNTEAPKQTEATAEPAAQQADVPQEDKEESQTGADEMAHSEQQEDAQGTMYEGALAGLTEEEIAAMAMAEESSAARTDTDSGVEGAVD